MDKAIQSPMNTGKQSPWSRSQWINRTQRRCKQHLRTILAMKARNKALRQSAEVPFLHQAHLEQKFPLTSLNHYFNLQRLYIATQLVNPKGKPGVDRQTLEDFIAYTDLKVVVDEVKSRTYRHSPHRQVDIPKPDGSPRTLMIPIFKDRVIQWTWLLIIGPILDGVFLNCSYGYRPNRNCHQAIHDIDSVINEHTRVWVVDADISEFFDNVPQQPLMGITRLYFTDSVLLHSIESMLGSIKQKKSKGKSSPTGIPQGGVLAPLLSNLFLHHVLDLYFYESILPTLKGWGKLVRYADDFIVLCGSEADARLAHQMIQERIEQYGLSLNPKKTTIRNISNPNSDPMAEGENPRLLNFLGIELSWHGAGDGNYQLQYRTAEKRREKAIQKWKARFRKYEQEWSEGNIPDLIGKLQSSAIYGINGFNNHYGIAGNLQALKEYEEQVYLEAAQFLDGHPTVGQSQLNPFTEDFERIWPSVKMRTLPELANSSRIADSAYENSQSGKEGSMGQMIRSPSKF